ncbi:hypothetical protein M885DRAFT_612768, partial [Pelagophyceae sp. CCMP2097]
FFRARQAPGAVGARQRRGAVHECLGERRRVGGGPRADRRRRRRRALPARARPRGGRRGEQGAGPCRRRRRALANRRARAPLARTRLQRRRRVVVPVAGVLSAALPDHRRGSPRARQPRGYGSLKQL